MTGQIQLRQGNGLAVIMPGEAEIAVIAGMGGATIRQIIQDSGDNAYKLKRLVLQPMSGAGQLRSWLTANGWEIEDEDLVREDSRIYEVISAVPGREKVTDQRIIAIGPRLFEKKHPLLKDRLALEIRKYRKTLFAVRLSTSVNTAAKRKELQEKIRNLEWVLECLSSAKQ